MVKTNREICAGKIRCRKTGENEYSVLDRATGAFLGTIRCSTVNEFGEAFITVEAQSLGSISANVSKVLAKITERMFQDNADLIFLMMYVAKENKELEKTAAGADFEKKSERDGKLVYEISRAAKRADIPMCMVFGMITGAAVEVIIRNVVGISFLGISEGLLAGLLAGVAAIWMNQSGQREIYLKHKERWS